MPIWIPQMELMHQTQFGYTLSVLQSRNEVVRGGLPKPSLDAGFELLLLFLFKRLSKSGFSQPLVLRLFLIQQLLSKALLGFVHRLSFSYLIVTVSFFKLFLCHLHQATFGRRSFAQKKRAQD